MALWIRTTGTNSWAELHRGGDDGRGGVRFDLSPAPTVSAMAGSLGGTSRWTIEDDGAPETVTAEPDPSKPPYRVPPVAEILALPRNGLTCMSTFSGCGGSCLGFEWAGYRPLLAVEFVPAAADSYEANHVGVPVYRDDIRGLTARKALALMGIRKGELDVLEGSPPCESFSTAGKLSAGWGQQRNYSDGKVQRMDDLFYEFTRLLGGIKPRAFMAENVAGLARGVSKGYFINIHRELEAQGYRVEARLHDAQWLGVPQRRKRVIFVGFRKDTGIDPSRGHPTPLGYRYSIRDALHDLARVDGISSRDGHEYTRKEIDPDGPVNTILRGGAALQRYEVVGVVGGWPRREMSADEPAATIGKGGYSASGEHEVIERIVYENGGDGGASRTGRDEEDLDAPARAITKSHGASGHFQIERVSHKNRGYFKRNGDELEVDVDDPANTITRQGQGEYMVEDRAGEPRKFTIAELRRLCGFPDDFALTGTYSQQWERLGNSVPPPMALHIAAAIRDALKPPRSRARGGASPRTGRARPPRSGAGSAR